MNIPTETAAAAPAARQAQLSFEGTALTFIDIPAILGERLSDLPMVLRLLLENVARHLEGEARTAAIGALLGWLDAGTSTAEIPFMPGRMLMHDTTSTPALVDIAGMRDVLAEAGRDPAVLNPVLPVEVSVDHSLAVEAYARKDAIPVNLAFEMRRNEERYRFLHWASQALDHVHVNPPGTGIMHTINLEQLATVATRERRGAATWVVPDTMLGTDSHTPMVNGLGVLGWGVGGLEAETVMFGMPTSLRIPDVVGVKLTGALREGVTATDLVLTVTKRLRDLGVAGAFVEFFGPGVSTLRVGQRCVVANMAPEYGATTGYFPIDDETLAYLRATGRQEDAIALVSAYAHRAGLWFDPQACPRYTKVLDLPLDAIGMHVAGPRRPQDLLELGDVGTVLEGEHFVPAAGSPMPPYPIAIAAITSCTNTTDPSLIVAAGLLARNALARGLKVPPWVKTSLSPGSPTAHDYLERAGLLQPLSDAGFDIVGYGCATCIGNSGPLPPDIDAAMRAGQIRPVAVLSGNRNFAGRIHPELDLGFLMSPPLVVAFAFAGRATVNLAQEPVGYDPDGAPVHLRDLWPKDSEVQALVHQGTRAADYARAFHQASENRAWQDLQAPHTARFPWDPASNTLSRPPFVSADEGSQLGRYTAWPLLVLGDDVTTDHISPASAIPAHSPIADYLVSRGEKRHNLNVFASRRGDAAVMVRASFYSKSLKNHLSPGLATGQTLHVPSGEALPIWVAAQRYREEGRSVVLVAGERYGTGSSRDWAAKCQRMLGIRAVLANSFERIHRSNLIGMGILPLCLPADCPAQTLSLQAGDRIEIAADPDTLGVRGPVPVRILSKDGGPRTLTAIAAVETEMDLTLLRQGGVIPYILGQYLDTHEPTEAHRAYFSH